MSISELEDTYDRLAEHAAVGLDFVRDEIVRRERAQLDQRMLWLTWLVAIFTAVATTATVVALFH